MYIHCEKTHGRHRSTFPSPAVSIIPSAASCLIASKGFASGEVRNAGGMTCSGKRLRSIGGSGDRDPLSVDTVRPTGALDGGLHWSARDVPVTRAGASPGSAPQGADGQDPAFRVFPGGQSKAYCGEWTGSHASYLSIGAGRRHARSISFFSSLSPHFAPRRTGVWRKGKKSRPFCASR